MEEEVHHCGGVHEGGEHVLWPQPSVRAPHHCPGQVQVSFLLNHVSTVIRISWWLVNKISLLTSSDHLGANNKFIGGDNLVWIACVDCVDWLKINCFDLEKKWFRNAIKVSSYFSVDSIFIDIWYHYHKVVSPEHCAHNSHLYSSWCIYHIFNILSQKMMFLLLGNT